ncbi:hypothetical protein DOH76_12370 [Salmonella enterica subsp. enterica serovar Oranienburg]|nr:hypothetical protein [Salmonella enterica]EBV3240354.1 hypothetical protein [Salmonella enterica subsp. enterica serovar Oranienburg]EAS1262651.1 hypothetical protein [Salmonella enterica]EBI7014818.1 hypothetical protein [Salmonella enterica]ECD0387968.1 hypothetical protein [Salmonella enterica subsp. enterica serovar Oranienburg]
MVIYSVIAGSAPDVMRRIIKEKFKSSDYLEVSDGFWLVHSSVSTPREMSAILSPKNDIGTFFVMPVTGYYGFHNVSVWDWLKSKGL